MEYNEQLKHDITSKKSDLMDTYGSGEKENINYLNSGPYYQ